MTSARSRLVTPEMLDYALLKSPAGTLLHQDLSLVERVLRDLGIDPATLVATPGVH